MSLLPLMLALASIQAAPAAAASPPPAADAPVDVVVVARPRTCRVQLGGKTLSDREFDAYARDWASGREVRITAPPGADYRCLAKIMFRLNDRGVKNATFVDPVDASSPKPPPR